MSERLPRTRGDGPKRRTGSRRMPTAPPHTRGWTPTTTGRNNRLRGSPAHAGMDPDRLARQHALHGLPRTRGDGPCNLFVDGRGYAAPPHTRGWTPRRVRRAAVDTGSPAHAGMDRGRTLASDIADGLPRTRGDGPRTPSVVRPLAEAPPHTRGWTPNHALYLGRQDGSPAHAGMDPTGSRPTAPHARLPRTRGDGPGCVAGCAVRAPAPPHTRGWTRHTRRCLPRPRGSPAHAGMDPAPGAARRRRGGLPRTRGDGPWTSAPVATPHWAPPHTRGWTLEGDVDRAGGDGSPAHAGMDPRRASGPRGWGRLPRTRGDGPEWVEGGGRLPKAPPHTRGWTPATPRLDVCLDGSPAHAGMDPAATCTWIFRSWLPRTRGDGPDYRALAGIHRVAPPHTRGWTQQTHVGRRFDRGSPAHAGMDPGVMRDCTLRNGLPRTRGDGPVITPSSCSC